MAKEIHLSACNYIVFAIRRPQTDIYVYVCVCIYIIYIYQGFSTLSTYVAAGFHSSHIGAALAS